MILAHLCHLRDLVIIMYTNLIVHHKIFSQLITTQFVEVTSIQQEGCILSVRCLVEKAMMNLARFSTCLMNVIN
jgi:hypothetical protein